MPRLTPLLLALLLLATPAPAAPVPKPVLTAEQEAEWDKLWSAATGNGNGASELRLVCRLLAEPRLGTEFLKGKLQPLKLSEREANDLLAKLGSDKEDEWKEAYRELRMRDVRLAMTLTQAWAETTTEEQRRRLAGVTSYWGGRYDTPWQWANEFERIYKSGDFTLLPPQPPGQEWRLCHTDGKQTSAGRVSIDLAAWQKENPHAFDCVRVQLMLRTLEQIGSAEGRKLIERVATGHPDVSVTKEAVAAVKRMKARPPATPDSRMTVGLRMLHFWQQPTGTAIDPAALAAILAHPDQTVPFLKAKLWPLKMTQQEGEVLLGRLFSDDPKECRAAFRELQYFDIRLAMPMEEAWAKATTADHRVRLVRANEIWSEKLSADFPVDCPKFIDYEYRNWPEQPGRVRGWHVTEIKRPGIPEQDIPKSYRFGGVNPMRNTLREGMGWRWDREESAIYLLDAIGTADALAIIRDMATGHPDAGPTKAAKGVLKRRGK